MVELAKLLKWNSSYGFYCTCCFWLSPPSCSSCRCWMSVMWWCASGEAGRPWDVTCWSMTPAGVHRSPRSGPVGPKESPPTWRTSYHCHQTATWWWGHTIVPRNKTWICSTITDNWHHNLAMKLPGYSEHIKVFSGDLFEWKLLPSDQRRVIYIYIYLVSWV